MEVRLAGVLAEAAHLLPAQGPIGVFIHHNTLHAFEDRRFEAAVREGAGVFGCEPYLTEDRYREALARGRIRGAELQAVVERDLGSRAAERVAGLASRRELRLAMLEHGVSRATDRELDWLMAETDALERVRGDASELERRRLVTETRHWVLRRLRGSLPGIERPAWAGGLLRRFGERRMEDWSESEWEAFSLSALWEACQAGVAMAGPSPVPPSPRRRHRDVVVAAGGMDPDALVHEFLIRICAAFLDQGIAPWEMPGREQGFFRAFCDLYRGGLGGTTWWLGELPGLLDRWESSGKSPLSSLHESLNELGVEEDETKDFLSATLLALRGWGGMLWHVEQRADRVHHAVPAGTLAEFVAVRLILDRVALGAVARESFGYRGPLSGLRAALTVTVPGGGGESQRVRAFRLFQLAQVLGWVPEMLANRSAAEWRSLLTEVEGFGELERRRVFHLAYEYRFVVQTLDALAARPGSRVKPKGRPSFQAIFCIDEREESIRRHLEEVAPTVETFGAAGFFGVVMYYRGAAAADFVPLCPVVVRPRHWVSESVDRRLEDTDRRRRSTRRRVGMALQGFHGGSRRIVSGAFLSASLGLLATVPLVMRVVFPRLTAQFKGFFGSLLAPPPLTRLNLERHTPEPSAETAGHGFLPGEMADMAERLLRDLGLTKEFARLVFVFGHGSTSMNNPHESAHDCGACGGGVGGPNARAMAEMLNDPRIRSALVTRGITIPSDTVFLGGLHNTANDQFTWADIDRVPATHRSEFEVAREAVREAAVRNAHERARRFDSAPLGITSVAAKRHMEGRAEDLSQVRPEWGHATNAICVVGRRERTRGLFLDRRAFLVSYDPAQDDAAATILGRILGAVVPVCSGINLEYYFSHVDPSGWGCGSKLPHNLTGLLGVMDGAQSDLRTGLPWQMVEIHEPVRLLFVIETTEERFRAIAARNPAVGKALENGWVQVALMDPDTGAVGRLTARGYEPHPAPAAALPVAATSKEWYGGWRDHLEFAEILAANPAAAEVARA